MATIAAAGARSDCEMFVQKFKERDSLRYEQFADIWQETNFSFIFYGKESEAEVLEFTEEIFRIAKMLWLSKSDTQERVCGFYLLYGFYVKQPTKYALKIRLTLSEWSECAEFMNAIIEDHHWDIYFIFRRMVLEQHAFQFVYLPLEITISVHALDQESEGEAKLATSSELLEDYFKRGPLQQMANINDRYEAIKQELKREAFLEQSSSLEMADPQAINRILRLASPQGMATTSGENRIDDDDNDNKDTDCVVPDIGTRRTRLKNKQFSAGIGTGSGGNANRK